MKLALSVILAVLAGTAGCNKKSDPPRRVDPPSPPPIAKSEPTPAPIAKPDEVAPPPADPTAGWAVRKAPGFTVLAPQDPTPENKDLPTAVGTLPSVIYGGYVADGSPGAFQVMVSVLPASLMKKTPPATLLTGMRDGLAKLFGGTTIDKEEDIKLGDEPGKDLRFSGVHPAMGAFTGRTRVFVHKGKLFQVQVLRDPAAADFALQADKFIESFVFVD